jgi:hypothetical protein
MKILYPCTLFVLSLISFNSFCQITIGEDSATTRTDTLVQLKNNLKPKRELDGSTEIFFGTTWANSNRKLIENGDFYGKELGLRADETKITTWSYNLGFRNYVHKNIAIEGGISLLKNGESYAFKGTDSTFNYQTTYSYIAMPLKVNYTYGEEIRLMIGTGFIPQMFTQYQHEQQWTNSVNAEESESLKTKNGYSSFLMSAVVSAGVQIKYSHSFSIYIIPEYRWQLNSSYFKVDPYKHYARVLGVNFGFVYQL